MCNKKERKRYRRWYLFPVSTLGAVYFVVHGGTGRFCFFIEAGRGGVFFSEVGRGGCFFFRGGTGRLFFFSEAGRGGFFVFDGTGRGGVFFCFFEGRDGTVVFGLGNFLGGTGQNRYTVPPAVHVKPCFFLDDQIERGKFLSKHERTMPWRENTAR